MNLLGLILLINLFGPGQATSAGPSFVSSRIDDRVVMRFDFDERKLGNFERTPMNWRQITGPGYPRFLEPRIDAGIGHAAAPAMRLALQGGSLACRYLAKDIPVHPDSDYRVSVWVRTEHQVYSEASISACFLDHALQRIEESSARCVALRIPSNQAAGEYVLTGVFTGSGTGDSTMTLRTPIAVGTKALDVNVMTRTEGRDLRIVQRITNRGERALDLRGLVIAPNRPRQVSTIRHLPPGQSIVWENQLPDAASLADRWIRVSLEEVAGPLRHHNAIKIETVPFD